MFQKSAHAAPRELPLIGLNEMQQIDRWQLESRCRALTQIASLGDGVMMCRVLGRYKMFVPASDLGFGAHVMMDGIWEPWLTSFVARRLSAGMTAIDVGANHGYYTVLFADLVGPTGHVTAIEPHPHTTSLLKRTVRVNGFDSRVKIVQAAAMAEDGQDLFLQLSGVEPKNAHVVGAAKGDTPVHMARVKGATIDQLLEGQTRVDFMKIDVEGAEEAAVAGSMGVIQRDRPDILLEFNHHRCTDAVGLLDRLEAIYGSLRVIDFDSQLVDAPRDVLLEPSNREDFSLYLTTRDAA